MGTRGRHDIISLKKSGVGRCGLNSREGRKFHRKLSHYQLLEKVSLLHMELYTRKQIYIYIYIYIYKLSRH
jgi:hypothetical protein